MTSREYHELTKHSPQSLSRVRHVLDWENMPDPFRHYEGVPVRDLPADPPTLDTGARFLSQLLYHSAAVSASKLVPSTGYRYALRVNPSSGNLHPTEFHFFTRGLKDWPDGLYHYRPSSHMAEQRALGDFSISLDIGSAPVVFILTSIAWREAWKYRDRAYRYCLLDIGHAWQALALAAQAMGCDSFAIGDFADDDVSQLLRLNEDEWPMLIVGVHGSAIPAREVKNEKTVWFEGVANRLSQRQVPYPLIDEIHTATKRAVPTAERPISLAETELMGNFGLIARARRSALDFIGGAGTISRAQLSTVLAAVSECFIQLYLYVHRVNELQPGVYRYWPETSDLEQIRSGDQRVIAAGLSLRQDLAGNACVAFSMIADFDRAIAAHGERGYRYVHFEAGAIGQRLYLAAESLGLGATGMGAFFDDDVNRYLNLESGRHVVYHFAIGYPVPDPRLAA
jgi:SagB-type dehydrogenase family enzyme